MPDARESLKSMHRDFATALHVYRLTRQPEHEKFGGCPHTFTSPCQHDADALMIEMRMLDLHLVRESEQDARTAHWNRLRAAAADPATTLENLRALILNEEQQTSTQVQP